MDNVSPRNNLSLPMVSRTYMIELKRKIVSKMVHIYVSPPYHEKCINIDQERSQCRQQYSKCINIKYRRKHINLFRHVLFISFVEPVVVYTTNNMFDLMFSVIAGTLYNGTLFYFIFYNRVVSSRVESKSKGPRFIVK